MSDLAELKRACAELMGCSDLTYTPIGIKFAGGPEDIPEDAIFPYRDRGERWAVCQLIQKARREKVTYAMTLEDHWCWYPVITYGHRKPEQGSEEYKIVLNNLGIPQLDREEAFLKKVPVLPEESVYATLIGPLEKISYLPDVILIYCDHAQILRRLIGAVKYIDGDMLPTELDYVNSCCWSILPTFQTRKFRVTIPDPGEIERAEMGPSEIILSVPPERFVELAATMELKESRFRGRPGLHTGLVPYFPRPEFIDTLYRLWGLEHGREISWTEQQRGY